MLSRYEGVVGKEDEVVLVTLKMIIDQAVVMWDLVLSSKGMISFKGVWRRSEKKFLQTGKIMKIMKMTSKWRTSASVRGLLDKRWVTEGT